MITAELVPTTFVPPAVCPPASTHGLTAAALATAYLHAVSADWRGDAEGALFRSALAFYWVPLLPPEPQTSPDAVSPHGGGGRGIQWYETATAVLGHVSGMTGGYRVPRDARLTDSWTLGAQAAA